MALPQPDPSLPGGAAPVFGDTDAARGDHLRANNQAIWENLEYLNNAENVDDAAEATPVDADKVGFFQIVGAVIKYVTFANLFAYVVSKLIAVTTKTTPVDDDAVLLRDSAAGNAPKWLSFTNLKAFLKTYFDILYAPTVFWVRDEKSSGTAAQSLSAATWNKRTLASKLNTISGASIASSVVTLPAGTYEATAFAETANATTNSIKHKIRLYDTTNTVELVVGSSAHLATGNTSLTQSTIPMSRFTLAGATNIELQHYVSGANSGGEPTSSGSVEVYAEVYFKKVE